MSSATERTLGRLRKEGYTVSIVEKWVPQARRRIDAFGIIDILAIRPGETVGVQSTTYSNVSAHIKKAREHENLEKWLAAGNRFVIYGWRKGVRGVRACRIVELETEGAK